MRSTRRRRVLAVASVLAVLLTAAGCSRMVDDPRLWREVSDEAAVFAHVLNDPTSGVPGPDVLIERLSALADPWGGRSAPTFIDDTGSAVFYNVTERPGEDYVDMIVSFDVFVSSGVRDAQPKGWFDAPLRRAYTCYRVDASFIAGWLYDSHRAGEDGDGRLACPEELVAALGDDAEYREPSRSQADYR